MHGRGWGHCDIFNDPHGKLTFPSTVLYKWSEHRLSYKTPPLLLDFQQPAPGHFGAGVCCCWSLKPACSLERWCHCNHTATLAVWEHKTGCFPSHTPSWRISKSAMHFSFWVSPFRPINWQVTFEQLTQDLSNIFYFNKLLDEIKWNWILCPPSKHSTLIFSSALPVLFLTVTCQNGQFHYLDT